MEINDANNIEENLLLAAKNGHQKAFTALMEKYQKSVYHLILKIVKSPEDAEDLTIVAFSKAFDHIDQYSADYAFSTWLYKISSNTCIDFLRKKNVPKISLDDKAKNITDHLKYSTNSTPEYDMIKAQRIDKLQAAVNTLDTVFSRVLTLRYFKEYSYEEMAEELGVSVGTIKVQLHRAKKKLMENFKTEIESW